MPLAFLWHFKFMISMKMWMKLKRIEKYGTIQICRYGDSFLGRGVLKKRKY